MVALKILSRALGVTNQSPIIDTTSLLHLADSLAKHPGMLGSHNMSHVILIE